MDMHDLALNPEMILEQVGEAGEYTLTMIQNAGGFIGKEGGKIALGVVIRKPIEDTVRRLWEAKAAGEVDDEFESTPHGAKLLQDALNAMMDGLDETRAEAVRDAFLNLARTKPGDSMEAATQLTVLDTISKLSTWEVIALNTVERFRSGVFDPILADKYGSAIIMTSMQDRKNELASVDAIAKERCPDFKEWMACDEVYYDQVRSAIDSLAGKGVFYPQMLNNREYRQFIFKSDGCYPALGLKVRAALYATDSTSD